MNIADDLVNAFNDGYKQGKIDAVVRGEWIKSALCEPSDWVKCSLCGRYFYLRDIQPTDNCPNCGAKMEDKP